MTITRSILLTICGSLWAVFVGLSVLHWNGLNLLNIVGFAALLFIPGLLITLGSRAGYNLPFWTRVGQCMGLSLLAEFVWLLLCNTVLPYLTVHEPLAKGALLIELSSMNVLIGVWSWPRLHYLKKFITRRTLGASVTNWGFALFPLLLVTLAVMGAVSLNNGSTNAFTIIMLLLASLYFLVLLVARKRLPDYSIGWALYLISLSLLLMNSMRGWYITGHDIQHEYFVFQITQSKGVWNIANFRDPYNACLSITILPTVLFNLLHIGSQYVYKILFQIIFATVPVLIYQLMRLYMSKAKALLSAVYFVSFPTFFTDMSFLNRQEIAYLFLSLMLLFVLNRRIALHKRKALFMVFGLGVILSHYSTTYAMIIIFVAAVLLRLLLEFLVPRMTLLTRAFARSSIVALRGETQILRTITVSMVLVLIAGAFVWNVILTDTANGATSLIGQIAGNFENGLHAGTRSNDVSYSLFSSPAVGPQQLINGYVKTVIEPEVRSAPRGMYYPTSVVNKYKVTPAVTEYAPLTKLGRLLSGRKIDVQQLNYNLKQTSAKVVQILAIIGLCYIAFSSAFNSTLDMDYFMLSIGSIFFVALQIVLPFLSEAYGILRAFQQALMLVGLYLVAGTFAIARLFKQWKRLSLAIPVLAALFFFLSSTNVLSAFLGGYEPTLPLSNSGEYYDEYYMHAQELAADKWLVTNVVDKNSNVTVQADLDTAIRLQANTGYSAIDDITPSNIRTYSYVLLGDNNTVNKQAFFSFDGNSITYNYPVQFLNDQKNLIYNNGGSEVYQ